MDYVSPFLVDSSVAVWSSVRSSFQNGFLFLCSDLTSTVNRCPGAQAIYDLGAACVLSLDDPPPDLRATANMFPPEGRMNVCFAINALLSDVSESVIEVLKTMPCQCNVTVLTTLSSSAHESSARTTLEADAYDYILSIWEDSLASSGGPQHVLRVQYFPMHVKVLGGVGFEVLLSETASKAIERDLHASATNDISYVRQVLSIAEHGVADEGNSHELEVLAHAIAGLRANLCIRPSLFAAGPVARKVSQLMHGLPTWPQPLSGTSPHAAALVLVDRAVDLSIVMEVPHTVAGLAGKMADPVVSSGKAGSVATTWWQEAAGRDDGFAAAEMVLQDVLPETLYHSGVLAAHSDLTARFLSGNMADTTPLVAHAARRCMAYQEAAQVDATTYDSLPDAALDGLPSEAASFTRAFLQLVQAPSSAPAAERAYGPSMLHAATRALVIGLAGLCRQGGGGTGHMDPVDAYLSMYGARIDDALAQAVDLEAATASRSVQQYIQDVRDSLFDIKSQEPTARVNMAASLAVPIAEAVTSKSLSRLLFSDSMSIHSSDAESNSSCFAPGSPSEWANHSVGACPYDVGRAVAEATEWKGGWEIDSGETSTMVAAGAIDESDGWAGDGWGDGGEWMDAPSSAPQPQSGAVDLYGGNSQTSLRTAPTPGPALAPAAAAFFIGASGASIGACPAASDTATQEQPKKVVKKRIVKKVVKKIVKRKVRTGSAAATQGDSSAAEGAADALPSAIARPCIPASAEVSSGVVVSAPGSPTAAACGHGVEPQPVGPTDAIAVPLAPPIEAHAGSPEVSADSKLEHIKCERQMRADDDSLLAQKNVVSEPVGAVAAAAPSPHSWARQREQPTHLHGAAVGTLETPLEPEAKESLGFADRGVVPAAHMMRSGRDTYSLQAECADVGGGGRFPVGDAEVAGVLTAGAAHTHEGKKEPDLRPESFWSGPPGSGSQQASAVVTTSAGVVVDEQAWSDKDDWGDDEFGWDCPAGPEDRLSDSGLGRSGINVCTASPAVAGVSHHTADVPTTIDDPLLPSLPPVAAPDALPGDTPPAGGGEVDVVQNKDWPGTDAGSNSSDLPDAELVQALSASPPDVVSPKAMHGDAAGQLCQEQVLREGCTAAPDLPCAPDAGTAAAEEGDGWGKADGDWGHDAEGWGGSEDWAHHEPAHGDYRDGESGLGRLATQQAEFGIQEPGEQWQSSVGHANAGADTGIGRGWADRAAAASDGNVWAGSWFVRGLESIASKVEAVVMSSAADDGTESLHGPSSRALPPIQTGPRGSWGPEQWEGWGSHLSAPDRSLHLAREIGSTASLPVGPADALLQMTETSRMEGVEEGHEEGPMRAEDVHEKRDSVDQESEITACHVSEGGADVCHIQTDKPAWTGWSTACAEDQRSSTHATLAETPGGGAEFLNTDVGQGVKQAATLAVVAEDQELDASGGIADKPAMAVPNAAVVAEVSADGPTPAEHPWGDSWSDAATLGTHADVATLAEDASLMTAGPDVASLSVEHGDMAEASAATSPPGSGVETDVGSANAGANDARSQGLSALAVHMHDAEASYVGASGASVRGTSDDASRPGWSVMSTLGTDALAAGLPPEEPTLDVPPLEGTGQSHAGLMAAVRAAGTRAVDLKQVGKELGWSIASTGGSAGERETGGVVAVPERSASPRKRLQEVMPEDVMGAQELRDAAERVLEAGWGDGWSDAATLGTQAEFEAAVLGLGTGDAPGTGDAGVDLQIVDEEGDGGGWRADGVTGGQDAGHWHDVLEDQAKGQDLDSASGDHSQSQGKQSWSGWGAWGQSSAEWGSQAGGIFPAAVPPKEASPEAKSFAHALVRIAARCARATGPSGGIVNAIVRGAKAELPDSQLRGVTHMRGAVSSMLSHGLGALGLGGADPNLNEFSRIVVVVLGGVTMEEVVRVSQAARSSPTQVEHTVEVLFGGVNVTSAEDLAVTLIRSA